MPNKQASLWINPANGKSATFIFVTNQDSRKYAYTIALMRSLQFKPLLSWDHN